MAISFQSALGIYESALNVRSERASVLSGNLANADTPNYKARDIDFKEALAARMGGSTDDLAMAATRDGHVNFDSSESMMSERLYRTPNQPSIDGNTVEEQVEHAEFMKNSLEFQTAFTLLNGKFKGLTKAIRGD